MKLLGALFFAVCVVLATLAIPVGAVTITFDNDPQLPGNFGSLPQYYGESLGIKEWSTNLTYISYPLSPYDPGSAPNRIYANGTIGLVKFANLVDFESIWLAEDAGTSASLQGYKNGTLVYSSSLIPGLFQGYVTLNWVGIDELRFSTTSANSAVWDDFKFSPHCAAPVPLPGGLLLLASGLTLLGIMKRRWKSR